MMSTSPEIQFDLYMIGCGLSGTKFEFFIFKYIKQKDLIFNIEG